MNIKNGAPLVNFGPGFLIFPFAVERCPNLQHVCADEINVDAIHSYTTDSPNLLVTSDCSLPLATEDFIFEDEIEIYPNPVLDFLKIHSKKESAISAIRIYNTLSQLILTTDGNQLPINVSGLKAGNYVVRLSTSEGINSQFIKR